jgi:serralysin
LRGGNGSDSFVYFTIKDSGVTKATRDVITDFGAGDTIDLRLIDANSKLANDQPFTFKGNNVAFVLGELGQVRAVTQLQSTVVQIDLNGDTKVDMEIELTGIQTLDQFDFQL